jgi:hypothetical protein
MSPSDMSGRVRDTCPTTDRTDKVRIGMSDVRRLQGRMTRSGFRRPPEAPEPRQRTTSPSALVAVIEQAVGEQPTQHARFRRAGHGMFAPGGGGAA